MKLRYPERDESSNDINKSKGDANKSSAFASVVELKYPAMDESSKDIDKSKIVASLVRNARLRVQFEGCSR